MQARILPYKAGSASARDLARELGGLRIKTVGSRYSWRPSHTLINWGCSSPPAWYRPSMPVLNNFNAVGLAANKLRTFATLFADDVPTVEWTDDPEEAQVWWEEGKRVYVRNCINCSSGDGIEIFGQPERESGVERLPVANLYTIYERPRNEYRIHVAGGEVIDFQRKARRYDTPDEQVNWSIRNYRNGFVYVRGGVDLPDGYADVATAAVSSLGLDFGGVDILQTDSGPKILEINSAPGLVGSTLINYATKLRSLSRA